MSEPTREYLEERAQVFRNEYFDGNRVAVELPRNLADLGIAYWHEVADRADEVDPEQEFGWYDLTVGWALGKGATPVQAHNFASFIRYYTDLG